jgi:lipid A 3-O-deacylase PagL
MSIGIKLHYKLFAFRTNFLYLLCTRAPVAGIKDFVGDTAVRRILIAFVFVILLSGPACGQAGPVEGGHELQVWTGGGHGISGSQSGDGIWNAGFRYGLILTAPHGPGFLRGRLEYAVDAVPIFLVAQKTNTAYGVGVNPFAFKWAFATRSSIVPYVEIGGGVLFTNNKVPEGTSHTNFTSGGAFGLHFLRSKYNIATEIRYMHISNAGLATPNPGINTIQFRLGFGLFSQKE